MKIAIAGGSGFIGTALVRRLVARGDDVAVLTRSAKRVRDGRPVLWDGRSVGPWADEVASSDAVVNLAGENIAGGRWTEARKKALVASRLEATGAIVAALRRKPEQPRVLVNASAIGYYGLHGDQELDESSPRGAGFLAGLTGQWEDAAREAGSLARLVILRFGIVLSPAGGALAKMLPPFRLGAGGPVASGMQWMSWISLADLVRMIEWALDHDEVSGVVNATAPNPVRSREFARALGRVIHRPAILPTPAFALRLAFGEMADEVLIGGQRVLPVRASRAGFQFESNELEDALRRLF